tara:strand:+ start:78 stop:704 length:627 start_codon:yes stop_codon:yes gene_type:complete
MKKPLVIFILCILFIGNKSYSQISATTSSGENVVLKSDGTWEYVTKKTISTEGLGNWEVKYFVDDFGDPTSQGYITNKKNLEGQFSNSAATNAKLVAYFIAIDSSSIALKLFEYGSSVVKAYSTDNYSVRIKDDNGETYSLNGNIYKGGDRLFIDDSYKKKHVSKLHHILLKGGKLTIVIKEAEYSLTSYKLSFDASGYKNAYNQLYK